MIQLRRLCGVFLAFSIVLRLGLAWSLPATYKEAYFWEWSLYPDWGYLDHPPLVSWFIGAFAGFSFLSPVFAMRLPALLLGTACFPLAYRLAYRLFDDRGLAYRSLLILACIPVMTALGTFTLPDTPQVFFHLLALNFLVGLGRGFAVQLGLGVAMGLAMMSKVTFILSFAALLIAPAPGWRRRELLLPALLMAMVFAPYIHWNVSHEWAGLRLQLWDRHWWDFGFTLGKVAEYSFEQIVAASPPLLVLIVFSLVRGRGLLSSATLPAYDFLRAQVFVVLGFFLLAGSCVTQTHPHWTALAYIPAAILLAALWTAVPEHRLFSSMGRILVGIQATFLLAGALAIASPQLINAVDPSYLSGSLERGLNKGKRRLLGLDSLAQEVHRVLSREGLSSEAPVYTNSYQLAAPLSVALGKKQVICLDAFTRDIRVMGHAQRYYLPTSDTEQAAGLYLDRQGHDGVRKRLERDFEEVAELAPLVQCYAGQDLASYRVYRVTRLRQDSRVDSPP